MRLLRTALLLLLLPLAQLALCAEDYYNILGITKTASDRDIKSAYRQRAKKYHPDKNPGDESAHQRFLQISDAYEALSDPETRKIYDAYGHEGLKQRAGGGGGGPAGHHHDPFDLFNRFFGGGGHFGGQQRRGQNVEIRVGIDLADFYIGRETEFSWNKQHICEACGGTGAADKVEHPCDVCAGRGITVSRQTIFHGMVQQVQSPCGACGGRGKRPKHQCKTCQGRRVIRKPTAVQLKIDRGAGQGSRIVYENEADADPDYEAGDLVVSLVEKNPELGHGHQEGGGGEGTFFRRRSNDLYWTEVLSMREAVLGGWSRNLIHLDGHVVSLGRERGQTVQPGHVEAIPGEGMPIWNENGDDVYHKTEFGLLYVEYVVVLPDKMSGEMRRDLESVLDRWGPAGKGAGHDEL